MTIRKQIIALLARGQWTAREISQTLHISEKEVLGHLEHVSRSLKKSFGINPAVCLACGFTFSDRAQIKCPSRCPKCRSEHIQEPAFFSRTL